MGTFRVAIIFDNTVRPETTGLYCRRALGSLVEVEHFLPSELSEISRSGFDLYLNIDDGLRYEWPVDLGPSACWIIDTHIDLNWSIRKARQFDFVFAAQRDGAEALRRAGVESTQWLPLACDPEFHRPHQVETTNDVCFVGNLIPGIRTELIEIIQREFKNTFVGRAYQDDMARIYSGSKIVFNRSVSNDMNMRVYEALACGSLLVTNDLSENGQNELFKDGKHFATYRDQNELLERIRFYLGNDSARERIAAAGWSHVLTHHTYLHRMVQLLRCVEKGLPQKDRSTPSQSSQQTLEGKTPLASACLLSWKRPDNVRIIIEALRTHPRIDDIVVWNNNPEEPLTISGDDITVVNSTANVVTYGRFLATQHARHDLIYTQDDDCIVENLDQIFETFDLDPTVISHSLKIGHLMQNSENRFGKGHVALLGWGSLFDRRWCEVLHEYIAVFGEDELLHRKADRIFTLMLKKRHRSIPAAVTDLSGASGPESLSVMADHQSLTAEAVSRVLSIQDQSKMPVSDTPLKRETVATTPQPVAGAVRNKDRTYFEFARPELLEMIPADACRVLDVGCGSGRLGESIKQRQSGEVWGVELDPVVANEAATRLDRAIAADVSTEISELSGETFDVIVCGDILEHLREPREFLVRCRKWLTPDGQIIASIPNVQHWTVIAGLLAGNWTYESAGLLDEDHVRFFTRREIEKLFFRAGFELDQIAIVPGEGYQQWVDGGSPGEIKVGAFTLDGLSNEAAKEFHAYQYLISASRRRLLPTTLVQGIASLASEFAWPERKPIVPIPQHETGWLADGPREALAARINKNTRVVLELGAWLGMSTRFIADLAPRAMVITVDHWEGSPEHQQKLQWKAMLPTLFETFLTMNWDYRDRIIPVRQSTQDGLRTVARHGLEPDVIFFDADHSTEAVAADVKLARELFPNAALVGDDYDDPQVATAIDELAADSNLKFKTHGQAWRAWNLLPVQRDTAHSPELSDALTSIVIVTHNQLGYTHQCLSSIRQFTDEPYELIVVDNGSSDGSVDYLRSLSDVNLVENAENRGFPAAANRGIREARGDQVLLLNNDTIVTTGWLRRMLDALHSSSDIGLVGPCSNAVSGEQQVAAAYQGLSSLDGFAWDFGQANRGTLEETDRLVGFCLLIRRSLIDKVGLLDEQFGIGCFEDDDLCRRATESGFRSVIARDAFVHHYGSVTFKATGVDFADVMRENQQRYVKKWQSDSGSQQITPAGQSAGSSDSESLSAQSPALPANPQQPAPQFGVTIHDDGGLLLTKKNPRLSLCMIVRDNENTIRPCLASIQPWVDEMIIVDTGSKDRTPEICQEFGAQVSYFEWCDDFSAARNESIKRATGDWIFWMDSDDTISPECGEMLRKLAHGSHNDSTMGYVMQVHCPGNDAAHDMTVVDHLKLFRNRLGLQFEGRIHEQIIPAIRRAGGEVEFTDIHVIHSGSDRSVEGRKGKLERDYRILYRELEETPDHPFVRFNLGMTHADDEQFEKAIEHLKRCIEVSGAGDSHLRKAYALLVNCFSRLGEVQEALAVCTTGLSLFPNDKELLFRKGLVLHEQGRHREAIDAYEALLNEPEDRHFTSVDTGISGFKARHNLAVVYAETGDNDKAEAQWRQALQEVPGYMPSILGLVDLLITTDHASELPELASQLRETGKCEAAAWMVNLRHVESTGNLDRLRETIHAARSACPGDQNLLNEECRILFERWGPETALGALRSLVEACPEDGAAWHNLGTAQSQIRDWKASVASYRRSISVRPDSPDTYIALGRVLSETGEKTEAKNVWQQGLTRCAGHPELLKLTSEPS